VTLLGSISGTPAEQYQRYQLRIFLQAVEREQNSRCGRVCDPADLLAELAKERTA
jgi:hypothetical protein